MKLMTWNVGRCSGNCSSCFLKEKLPDDEERVQLSLCFGLDSQLQGPSAKLLRPKKRNYFTPTLLASMIVSMSLSLSSKASPSQIRRRKRKLGGGMIAGQIGILLPECGIEFS